MSLQVFLQAQLTGADEFLAAESSIGGDHLADFAGRCAWWNLYCEVLPRALLSELKLSRMLLGSSSAEQFLLVLAEEDISRANDLLTRAAEAVSKLSGNTLRLVWASTENLGAWPVARKRLDDALASHRSTPLSSVEAVSGVFEPFADASVKEKASDYFAAFAQGLISATSVGWSRENPAQLIWNGGEYSWPLTEARDASNDAILFPRRIALNDASERADVRELAQRAEGAARWGILIGDVDQFDAQLRRVGSVEEHIQLSVLFRDFFAGELSLLCALPDFWRTVSVLYCSGDGFAVMGSWDALLALARELQRLFERFAEQNLQGMSPLEGKSVSMALAIAPEEDADPSSVYAQAIEGLRQAKTIESGSFHLFGRVLEPKRLADAEELKSSLIRLVRDFGYSPDYIQDLASVYRESLSARSSRRKAVRVDKPWRIYMRLARVIPQSRGKELNNLRNSVIASLIGKRTTALKLRPSGRVGLEWARLATDGKS
jgi:CRISPR-associated protein Csm1